MTTTKNATNATPDLTDLVDRYLRAVGEIDAMPALDDATLDDACEAGPNAILRQMASAEVKSVSDASAVLRWLKSVGVPIKRAADAEGVTEATAAMLAASLDLWLLQAMEAGDALRRAFPPLSGEGAKSTRQQEPRLFELVDHASDLVTAVNGAFLAVKGLEDATERAGLCWLLEGVEHLAKGLHHQLDSMDDVGAERVLQEAGHA